MNLFPEIRFLKWIIKQVGFPILVWTMILSAAGGFYMVIVSLPAVHAVLWPGWAIGLVTAYLGTVIVRLLR